MDRISNRISIAELAEAGERRVDDGGKIGFSRRATGGWILTDRGIRPGEDEWPRVYVNCPLRERCAARGRRATGSRRRCHANSHASGLAR